jgi:hypothetical protein
MIRYVRLDPSDHRLSWNKVRLFSFRAGISVVAAADGVQPEGETIVFKNAVGAKRS